MLDDKNCGINETHHLLGRVALGIPLYGCLHAFSVIHLLNHLAHAVAKGTYGVLSFVEGAYIDQARNTIVREVLKIALTADPPLTHLFFLDQDVIVPPYTVERLLSHNLDVVGAVYFGKDSQHLPVAFQLEPFERLRQIFSDGLQPVDGIGMGATLINLDVFRKMKEHFQDEWWFRCTSSPEGNEVSHTGEDIWFAQRCKTLGIPIYLDCSLQCEHISITRIGYQHYLDTKERLSASPVQL